MVSTIFNRSRVVGIALTAGWAGAFYLGTQRAAALAALTAASIVASAAALILAPSVRERLRPPSWRRALRDLAIGAFVGFVTIVATLVLYPVLRDWVPALSVDVRGFYDLVPFSLTSLPLIVIVIVAEELLWRGLFLEGVALGERPDTAAVVAGVLACACYGLGQLGPGAPVLAGAALLLGAIWTVEAYVTGALVAPLVSHAMWTLTIFGVQRLE